MKRYFPKKLILGLFLLVAIALIVYFRFFYSQGSAPLQTITLTTQDLNKNLIISGQIDAQQKAILRFQAGGKLVWLGAKEGDTVKKWQTIASLDKESLKKNLEKSLNDYQTTRWNFEQNRDDLGVTSNDYANQPFLTPTIIRELEKDNFALNNSVIAVELNNLALQYASITSPIDGILVQMSHQVPGVNVTPTDTFTIIDPNSLIFTAQIDEIDIGLVQLNQSATIVLDSFPDLDITGQVSSIDFLPSVGDGGGTVYNVDVTMSNPPDNLRLGMNGDVSLLLDSVTNAQVLPLETLITRDDQNYVNILSNGKVTEVPVTVGLETDTFIQITNGLSPDDQVVLPSQEN